MNMKKLSLLLIFLFLGCFIPSKKEVNAKNNNKPLFELKFPGSEFPVRYENYGEFRGQGTKKFRYKINDRPGLAAALGSGVYPNIDSIFQEPQYQKWAKNKPNNIIPWEFTNTGDPETEFFVWASAKGMGPGTKLFFTAQALAEAHLYEQALKAYYAILIHFPSEPVWSADHSFVWYVGPAALNQIETLTKHHPEIGVRLKDAICEVQNDKDTDLNNDEVIVDPGHWVKRQEVESFSLKSIPIIQKRGSGKVRLIQYENKHWQLIVDNEPMMVRGINYQPTKVGEHVSDGKGSAWMVQDENGNGLPDAPYDSWLDLNGNGKQDRKERAVGDFQIMADMGVNAIRIFRGSQDLEYDSSEFNKKILRDLYKRFGISVIMGEYLGAYTVGSGAEWNTGTDYTDPEQLKNMKSLVRSYVMDHRDEPYVLMWLLGNENLMPSDYTGVNATRTKASRQVREYLEFVNEIAEMIHELDPDHPVAVGNLDLTNLKEHAKYAPAVDIMGLNGYRGEGGFGNMWNIVQRKFDRPVLITEYGCDAYNYNTDAEDEKAQAAYHRGNWQDIELNSAGQSEEGNAIGGVIFEYVDEWWKSSSGSWNNHDTSPDTAMAFPDGWAHEEWYGMLSQGDGENSPFLRKPREVYYLYKNELWKQ